MPLQSGGYTFKPHEMPFMPGSPASPEHPKKRRLAYLAIGLLLALSSGFQNGLLTASLPQLRGDLSLDLQQGGWIQAAYFMAYACMSVLFFKVRKAYGLQRFVRITLFAQLAASLLQLVYHHYEVQLIACVAAAIAASGLLVLSIYYMMQGFTGTKKLAGLVFGLGLMQVGTPLAQSLVPLLYGDGDLNGVFAFQATLALACTACLFALPLPPGITVRKSFTLTDALSFTLFASGIALLCAFLVQGRTVWWTTQWLGWLLAGGVGLTGLALYIESTRHKPMLDWHWMTVPQILIFAVMGTMARLLTSEQTVGAAGLMGAVGVGSAQMSTFYLIVAGGMLAGVVGSLILLDINDIRRPVMVALACFALGAWLEIGVGMQTRPAQLYFSQFIVAFASLLFMGPMMLEGALRALAKSPDHMMSFSAVVRPVANPRWAGGCGGIQRVFNLPHPRPPRRHRTKPDPLQPRARRRHPAQRRHPLRHPLRPGAAARPRRLANHRAGGQRSVGGGIQRPVRAAGGDGGGIDPRRRRPVAVPPLLQD